MQKDSDTGTAPLINTLGRLLNIFDYALGSLYRKAFKNFLVFLVFSVIVFLFASFQLMTSALSELGQRVLVTAPDITVQQMAAGRQIFIANSQAQEIRRIFGVRRVTERVWGYYFDEKNGANYTVWGLDPRDTNLLSLLSRPTTGEWPEPPWQDRVVMGEKVQKLLGLGQRKMFSLFRPDLTLASFEVAGTFDHEFDLLTGDTIFMANTAVRDLFRIPSSYSTELQVDVANPGEIDNIAVKISNKLPGVRVITRSQILKTYRAVFGWRSGFGLVCLLAAVVSFAILSWDKATGLSREEFREVGILKVLGWQTGDIVLIRFFESFALATVSFLVVYLLACVHVLFFDGSLSRSIFLGWSVLRPDFRLVPPFNLEDVIVVLVIGVVPYMSATVIPAWRAATVPADSVI